MLGGGGLHNTVRLAPFDRSASEGLHGSGLRAFLAGVLCALLLAVRAAWGKSTPQRSGIQQV